MHRVIRFESILFDNIHEYSNIKCTHIGIYTVAN